jgi:hypothetical protein
VAPVSTRTPAIPALLAITMSVLSRSPTIAESAAARPSRSSTAAAMCLLGLPTTASAMAPVQAWTAASMAAQSGSPPSGVGQYGSGLVATNLAPPSRTAR